MKKIKVIFLNKIVLIGVTILALTSCSQGNLNLLEPNNVEELIPTIPEVTTTPFLPDEEINQESVGLKIIVPDGFKNLFFEWGGEDNVISDQNTNCMFGSNFDGEPQVDWILSLVAPFNTITDGLDKGTIINYLSNKGELPFPYAQLVMPPSVYEVMNELYNQDLKQILVVEQSDIVSYLYNHPQTLAIIPFDQITPALKVLRMDLISPFDQNFSPKDYELSIQLGLSCGSDQIEDLPTWTNRDPEKFTSVILTGTTALTRAIASRMEINGNQYPGEKIKDWFDEADISHISNEVSYYGGCPPADPNQSDLFFCGRPEYTELFSYLGVDVIELTGNHLTDKGVPPLIEMMSLFDTMGIPYYAAGLDAASAAKPLYFENNGNRIAFLGCNAAGPTFVYASDYRAGVNPCDMDILASQVAQVVEEGYLPIVTFQYWETYQFQPMPWQRDDSRKMIDNGAVIVSGSQAHLPMTMESYKQGFIHYGLGNLFFDQMDIPVVGTRREFADRHIFYDGSYLGVELKTAMLEDYSQPRPMTDEERKSLLFDAFEDFIYQP